VLVALSAGLAVWAHSRAGKGGAFDLSTVDFVSHPVREDRPAPRFSVPLLAGNGSISLGRYSGRILVVNVWASWCGPCRREAPALEQVWRTYRARGVAFVGIDHLDGREEGQAFVREFGLSYPMAFDQRGTVARSFGSLGIPSTYVIAPNGYVAYSFLGRVQAADLAGVLDDMLRPSAPA
jgi:peroxiredoxin